MSVQLKSLIYSTLCISSARSFPLHYHYPAPGWISVGSHTVFPGTTLGNYSLRSLWDWHHLEMCCPRMAHHTQGFGIQVTLFAHLGQGDSFLFHWLCLHYYLLQLLSKLKLNWILKNVQHGMVFSSLKPFK